MAQDVSELFRNADPIKGAMVARDVDALMKCEPALIHAELSRWAAGDEGLRKSVAHGLLERAKAMVLEKPVSGPTNVPHPAVAARQAKATMQNELDAHVNGFTRMAGRVAHHAAALGAQVGEHKARQRWAKQKKLGKSLNFIHRVDVSSSGVAHPIAKLPKGTPEEKSRMLTAIYENSRGGRTALPSQKMRAKKAAMQAAAVSRTQRVNPRVETDHRPARRLESASAFEQLRQGARAPARTAAPGLGSRLAAAASGAALNVGRFAARRPLVTALGAGLAYGAARHAMGASLSDRQRAERSTAAKARWSAKNGPSAGMGKAADEDVLGPRLAKAAMDNKGHGHVFAREDGFKLRCGGPAKCATCATDKRHKADGGTQSIAPDATAGDTEGRHPPLGKSAAHPGFAAVQTRIAKKDGVSHGAAGAILAAASRNAGRHAKKINPRLKRVKA